VFDVENHSRVSAVSAHQFFIENGSATVSLLHAHNMLFQKTVGCASSHVLMYLSRADRESFVDAADVDPLHFPSVDARLEALKKALDSETVGAACAVISDPACERRISRYKRYPSHPRMTLEFTVGALTSFSKTRIDRLARHKLLKIHMDKLSIKIRDDSCFCSEFINGVIDVDPEEVATTMSLTSQLFTYGHKAWSLLVEEYEEILCTRVFEDLLSWKEALQLTKQDLVRDPRRLIG
jgi:hypothetical protein